MQTNYANKFSILVRRFGADVMAALTRAVVDLATKYGRYGYRRVTALLRDDGWHVNHKRVERIWRREGLKVPHKQPKRARLWLNDGSCVRLRPTHRHHVWSYDFVMDRHSTSVPIMAPSSQPPKAVRQRLNRLEVQTLFIESGSPWENGYNESFNGKLRDELLNGEFFFTLQFPELQTTGSTGPDATSTNACYAHCPHDTMTSDSSQFAWYRFRGQVKFWRD